MAILTIDCDVYLQWSGKFISIIPLLSKFLFKYSVVMFKLLKLVLLLLNLLETNKLSAFFYSTPTYEKFSFVGSINLRFCCCNFVKIVSMLFKCMIEIFECYR